MAKTKIQSIISKAGMHTGLCILAFGASMSLPAGVRAQDYRFGLTPLTAEQKAAKEAIPQWRPKSMRAATVIPEAVDNSKSKYFPAIFNQGSNNSCSQASGVRYTFTYEVNRMLDRDASDPANVFCYHFTWTFLNEGANQGSHAFLGYDLMKDCGALNMVQMEDKEYSYPQQTQWVSGYQTYLDAMKYRVESYSRINLKTRDGIDMLRRYLYDHGEEGTVGGIAVISYDTDDWGLKSYSGPNATGLRHIVTKEGKDGAHAITVVGYDDTVEYDFDGDGTIGDTERGAFIFANSWGEDWGSRGKCYIPYSVMLADPAVGGLTEGDADAYMVTPVVGEPQMAFRVKVEYNRRNELSFMLGAADGADAKLPTVEFTYPIMNRQGGAEPMQGYNASTQMEVAFNFSRYYDRVSQFRDPKFFLTVRRTAASGTGRVIDFSVIDLVSGMQYLCAQHNVALNGGQVIMTTGDQVSVYTSCSKWRWLLPGTPAPTSSPFVLKTASGQPVKMMINGYDKASGKLTIKYRRL